MKSLTFQDTLAEKLMVIMEYENVVFPNLMGFHCKNCGDCCRNQPPDINFKEEKNIETAGYRNFMQDPSKPNNRSIRSKKDGSCFFYTPEHTCKINDIKPSICILEPFIIVDFDYRTNKIFLGLNPLAKNNCKGISAVEIVPFKEIAKAAQTIVTDFSEIIAAKTGLSITDKKVAKLTQKLLRE
jgi:Fe-S-cluster containining protein